MDAIKRAALRQGIDDFLKRTSFPDEAARRAACDDLLRRARVDWRDMLVLPLIVADPDPIRLTAAFGLVIHELQEHAEPMWLPCAAVWQATSADDPAVLQQLRTMAQCLWARHEASQADLARRGWPGRVVVSEEHAA